MKRRDLHIILPVFVLLIVASTGCTKYLDFEGENAPPRLVVNGLMMPDSNFTVELSNSLGYIDIGNIQLLENGKVAVFDGEGNFIDSLLHQGQGRYRSNSVAQAGENYTIRAQAGSFEEASATDRVPTAVPIAGWDTLVSPDDDFEFGGTTLTVFVDIADPAGEENYYLLELYAASADYYLEPIFDDGVIIGYDTIYYSFGDFRQCLSTSDPVLMSENDVFAGDLELYSCGILFSDRLFNGQNRRFSVKLESFFGETDVEIRLSSLSADYYQYVRTLEQYEYTEGDPFAEPVQVFSNLNGNALGIWGGASFDKVEILFE